MIRTIGIALAAFGVLAAGCQSQPKNEMNVVVGPDGKLQFVPSSNSPEDLAIAALLNSASAEADTLDKDLWITDDDDNITHILSGATCPAIWSGLEREKVTVYRPDGTDVGCNFVSRSGPTVMTFYVFNGGSVNDEINGAFESMKARQPVSRETSFTSPSSNGTYKSRTLAYEAANGTAMRTSVLVGEAGGWVLKIRLTCTAAEAPMAEQVAGLAILGPSDRLRSRPRPPAKPSPV